MEEKELSSKNPAAIQSSVGNLPSDQPWSQKILELTALYEISKVLASSLDLKTTTHQLMEILSQVLGMRRGTLTLLNQERGELAIEVAHGLTPEEIARGRYKIGEGITGKVMETGEPIIVPDVGKEPLFLNRTHARGDITKQNISFICVPVKVKGETIGVLSVDRLFPDKNISFDEDVRVLTVVASMIGQAVMLSRMVAQEKQKLIDENIYLKQELKTKYRLANIVGNSEKMGEIFEIVEKVAPTKATVLLRGESGTGKELIARAIHYNSPRASKPFVKVNCAALPETLLESELFGHEKGSFTGAIETKKGRFEIANGGTLFLDEIGDLSLSTQIKLLRVLQEKQFERIGGIKTYTVDLRIIAATHKDLEKAIREGSFREDLYYRLNVVPIFIPPLRERKEDVPLLVEHFLKLFNRENGKNVRFSSDVTEILQDYSWPGNIRELENFIERVVVMAKKEVVSSTDLPGLLPSLSLSPQDPEKLRGDGFSLPDTIEALEKKHIQEVMRECGGIQSRATKLLGITPRQLGYRIRKYQLSPKGD